MRLLSIGVTPGLLVLGVLLLSASARQLNFATTVGSEAFASYDDGLLTPLGDLSLLSSSEYTTLTHPVFPRYSVRVKQSDFCDGAVQ